MSGRLRRVGTATLVIGATLAMSPGATQAAPAPLAQPPSHAPSQGVRGLLDDLIRLTQKATVRGRRIMNSQEVRVGRRVANDVRKATNYYCDQWVEYYRYWFAESGTDAEAVDIWRYVTKTVPQSGPADAYSWCGKLAYWKLLYY